MRGETLNRRWRPLVEHPQNLTEISRSSVSQGGRQQTNLQGHQKNLIPSNQEEPESVVDLFGEGWLQDPNCVGSSVAALGEEPSD